MTKYLLRSGHHIDVILQQGVEVGHMEIVELGLVRKHEEGGPGLGEAPGEAEVAWVGQVQVRQGVTCKLESSFILPHVDEVILGPTI